MSGLSIYLIAASLILGVFYGFIWLERNICFWRSLFKTLPVAVLALAALTTHMSGATSLILFAALAMSAAGDGFLSRDGEKMFLAGLGSFLLSHLVYIALFVIGPGTLQHSAFQTVLLICAVVALAIIILRNLWAHLGEMRVAVIFYTLVIGTMVISAWITGQSSMLLVGVILFAFSDMVLAHEMFVWKAPMIKRVGSYMVWVSYLAAQVIITASLIS